MSTVKQRRKEVLALLDLIIEKNLPYSQFVFYQHKLDNPYIFDFDKLVESGMTCCFMGYLMATPEFKENGGIWNDKEFSVEYKGERGAPIMDLYLGIPGAFRYATGMNSFTPQQFKDFILERT